MGQPGSVAREEGRAIGGTVDLRASDAERAATAELLTAATGAGLLRLDEADDRLAAAYAARTRGELAALTADLPSGWLEGRRRAAHDERRRAVELRTRRQRVRAGMLALAVLAAGWLAGGLAAGAWFPWLIWPVVFWVVPALTGRRVGCASPRVGPPRAAGDGGRPTDGTERLMGKLLP